MNGPRVADEKSMQFTSFDAIIAIRAAENKLLPCPLAAASVISEDKERTNRVELVEQRSNKTIPPVKLTYRFLQADFDSNATVKTNKNWLNVKIQNKL